MSELQGIEVGTPDISHHDAVKLCEELELIETLQHGGHDYCRLTQKGVNIFATLLLLLTHKMDPDNILKPT